MEIVKRGWGRSNKRRIGGKDILRNPGLVGNECKLEDNKETIAHIEQKKCME